jgi:DNA-binding GntR family transcriptional regulator
MQFKRLTYSDQIYEYLKKRIMDGELPPGSPIKESSLSNYLEVSRAPVREAVQKLCGDEVVMSVPQKGTFVRVLTSKDIMDSYGLAGILESSGVSGSLDLWTDSDMARLEQIVASMRQQSHNDSGREHLIRLEETFHETLLQRCGNGKLINMAKRSCAAISKILLHRQWSGLFPPLVFFKQHEAIAQAAYTRDPAATTREILLHYQETGNAMAKFGQR